MHEDQENEEQVGAENKSLFLTINMNLIYLPCAIIYDYVHNASSVSMSPFLTLTWVFLKLAKISC